MTTAGPAKTQAPTEYMIVPLHLLAPVDGVPAPCLGAEALWHEAGQYLTVQLTLDKLAGRDLVQELAGVLVRQGQTTSAALAALPPGYQLEFMTRSLNTHHVASHTSWRPLDRHPPSPGTLPWTLIRAPEDPELTGALTALLASANKDHPNRALRAEEALNPRAPERIPGDHPELTVLLGKALMDTEYGWDVGRSAALQRAVGSALAERLEQLRDILGAGPWRAAALRDARNFWHKPGPALNKALRSGQYSGLRLLVWPRLRQLIALSARSGPHAYRQLTELLGPWSRAMSAQLNTDPAVQPWIDRVPLRRAQIEEVWHRTQGQHTTQDAALRHSASELILDNLTPELASAALRGYHAPTVLPEARQTLIEALLGPAAPPQAPDLQASGAP